MIAAALALLAGCPRPAPPPPAAATETEAERPPPPCGELRDGRYIDGARGFSIAVPEDWIAEPGLGDATLRVRLSQAVTELSLEVSVYPEAEIVLRDRAGCAWTFWDQGAYTALGAETVQVASCTPHDPRAPRIQGWYTVRDPWAYHLELSIPDGYLGPALQVGEAIVNGFRLEGTTPGAG